MDYTIMIIASRREGITAGVGVAMTSQLKSFPTRGQAEYAVDAIVRQAINLSNKIEVVRLYDPEAPT